MSLLTAWVEEHLFLLPLGQFLISPGGVAGDLGK